MIPIYFTQRFEKPGNVSRDLAEKLYYLFAEMAENLVQMGKYCSEIYRVVQESDG